LRDISRLAATLAASEAAIPTLAWLDDQFQSASVNGNTLSVQILRDLCSSLIAEARLVLANVGHGFQLQFSVSDIVYDELNNQSIGYSFVSDPSNSFEPHRMELLKHLACKKGDVFISSTSAVTGVSWNLKAIANWMDQTDLLLQKIIVLVHIGSGQPIRGSEYSAMRIKNSANGPRNVYFINSSVMIFQRYRKSRNIKGDSPVPRFLPTEVANIFLAWLIFLVPARQ
jgi:hypothetical protein